MWKKWNEDEKNTIKWHKRKKRNNIDHQYDDIRQVERINDRESEIRNKK